MKEEILKGLSIEELEERAEFTMVEQDASYLDSGCKCTC